MQDTYEEHLAVVVISVRPLQGLVPRCLVLLAKACLLFIFRSVLAQPSSPSSEFFKDSSPDFWEQTEAVIEGCPGCQTVQLTEM
jgi:hypothetical protein